MLWLCAGGPISLFSCLMKSSPELMHSVQCLGIQEGRMDRMEESGEEEATARHGNASPYQDSLCTGAPGL